VSIIHNSISLPQMKTCLVLTIAALVGLACPAVVHSAPITTSLPLSSASINVKDFGAKGDGIADDTKAIQTAVRAMIMQYEQWPLRVRHWNKVSNGITDNPHSEIVFPEGTYKISSPIVFRRYASVRGIGKAVIHQVHPGKDSFYFHGLLRSTVENLQFDGGRIQLRFWTANNGTARVNVQNSVFSNSSGYAVECTSFSKKLQPGEKMDGSKRWSPYEVEWTDGYPQITENSATDIQLYNNSTYADIAHCRFENVRGVADLSGDSSAMRDCQISVSPQLEGAVFRLTGLMHLQRIKAVAQPAAGKNQHWIETEGRYREITVRDCDFNTATPQGICLMRSKAIQLNSSIIVDNSRVKSAGAPEGGLIWIATDTQPSIITVRNTTETSGKPVKTIVWEKTPAADWLKDSRGRYGYAVSLENNSPNLSSEVPATIKPLLLNPIPAPVLQASFVPTQDWEYQDLENQALATGKVLQATDYGVDQDPKTDDTATIQKAFDAASAQGASVILFPAGVMTLSDTLRLPRNVIVRGAGATSFAMNRNDRDIFAAQDAQAIGFKNCDFSGGRNGLNLGSSTSQKSRLAFDNCAFYDQQEKGIVALAGKGEIGEQNLTELRVMGGIFATKHALTTNASLTYLGTFWAMNDPHLNDDAFIRNMGGAMRMQAVMMNPILWQGERSKPPATLKDWQLSKNTRWLDNWGKLYLIDNRFGGESGGMCNVYQRSEKGSLYIEGGITRFMNSVTRQSVVMLEKTPRHVVLRDISGMERSGVSIVSKPDGSDGKSQPGVILRGVPVP
jgi:hypothetical protein